MNEEANNLKILNENDHILKYIEDIFVNEFFNCIITEYCEVICKKWLFSKLNRFSVKSSYLKKVWWFG
jgi:hypothetical protein